MCSCHQTITPRAWVFILMRAGDLCKGIKIHLLKEDVNDLTRAKAKRYRYVLLSMLYLCHSLSAILARSNHRLCC